MARKARRAKRASGKTRIKSGKTFRVLLEVSPHESLRNMRGFRLDHCCMPQPPADQSGTQRLHAFAKGSTIQALRKAGRKVKVLADAEAEGKRAQKQIGKGDRFEGGHRPPSGVGKLV
jgi:hypothetical protein